MNKILIVVILALVAIASARPNLSRFGDKTAIPQKLSRNAFPPQQPLTFSWDNCGSSSDPAKLTSLSISPDPIVLGENITVSGSGSLAQTVDGTSWSVALTIEKKIFGVWTEIPCVDQVGSCTIDDFCALLTNPDCGPVTPYHIPCQCPFPAGSYNLPAISIATKNPNVSWLTNGDFYVKAELYNGSTRAACYEVYASLST